MTTLQMKVAIATQKYGSISNAAKELEISQPNASNCIKTLESEIGFPIFIRAKSGTTLTEKGRLFLEHARRIMLEHDSIMDIHKHENIYRLRLGFVRCYSAAFEPFMKISMEHCNDGEADLRCCNISIDEGFRMLDSYDIDLMVLPLMKSQLSRIIRICDGSDFMMTHICNVPGAVKMRRNHPAALDGRCLNISQGSDAMKAYPYVAYRNSAEDNGAIGCSETDYIRYSYKIIVDSMDTRIRIAGSTDAFYLGIMNPDFIDERNGLISFPLHDVSFDVYCITRCSDECKKEVDEYISLLREELDSERDETPVG